MSEQTDTTEADDGQSRLTAVLGPIDVNVSPICKNCRYWEYFGIQGDESDDEEEEIGTCCRYPPQRVIENSALLYARGGIPLEAHSVREWEQPNTRASNWCGEFVGPNG